MFLLLALAACGGSAPAVPTECADYISEVCEVCGADQPGCARANAMFAKCAEAGTCVTSVCTDRLTGLRTLTADDAKALLCPQ